MWLEDIRKITNKSAFHEQFMHEFSKRIPRIFLKKHTQNH